MQTEEYRRLQAAAMLKLFRQANGKDAESADELGGWAIRANLRQPIVRYPVLTKEEIKQALK